MKDEPTTKRDYLQLAKATVQVVLELDEDFGMDERPSQLGANPLDTFQIFEACEISPRKYSSGGTINLKGIKALEGLAKASTLPERETRFSEWAESRDTNQLHEEYTVRGLAIMAYFEGKSGSQQ